MDDFDPDKLFAPELPPPEPTLNIWGRRRAALTSTGELPDRSPEEIARMKKAQKSAAWTPERRAKFMRTMEANRLAREGGSPAPERAPAPGREPARKATPASIPVESESVVVTVDQPTNGRQDRRPSGGTIRVIADGVAVCGCCNTILASRDGRLEPLDREALKGLAQALRAAGVE